MEKKGVPMCAARHISMHFARMLVLRRLHEVADQRVDRRASSDKTGRRRKLDLQDTQNRLIAMLPSEARERLLRAASPVELPLSQLLCERDDLTTHVYFPTTACISLISLADARAGVELGMIGCEGMLGAHLCLNVFTSPLRGVVQGAGHCWRLPAEVFIDQMQSSPALRYVMQRYQYFLSSQQATSAACLRFHLIDQRLARWLLMSQDRANLPFFPATQEFLAYMLGVRRVGTSIATSSLLREGLIEYRHGQIRVVDRDGLRLAVCSCYAADLRAYGALFPHADEPGLDAETSHLEAPVPQLVSDVPARPTMSDSQGRGWR